jgi:hypothetical protein
MLGDRFSRTIMPVSDHWTNRLIRELDIHYLVISFVGTILLVPAISLVPIGNPIRELLILWLFSLLINASMIVLSFLGIAPWGFTKQEMIRCSIWIPTNLIAGTIFSFLILSPRAVYSSILYVFS